MVDRWSICCACCACCLINATIQRESNPPYCAAHLKLAIDIGSTQEAFGLYRVALDELLPEIKQMVLQLVCDLI